jgi:hypothetical protein
MSANADAPQSATRRRDQRDIIKQPPDYDKTHCLAPIYDTSDQPGIVPCTGSSNIIDGSMRLRGTSTAVNPEIMPLNVSQFPNPGKRSDSERRHQFD